MDNSASDESSNDSENIRIIQRQEEEHFSKLFNEILNHMLFTQEVSEEEVREALTNIISSFRYDLGGQFSDIDYSQPDKVCGYLFRYGSHGAGLARYRVLQALQNCEAFSSCLGNSVLRVVSLGGGPGNDAIGFCSALFDLEFSGRLVVKVVDRIRTWSKCVKLAKTLLPKENFGNVSQMFLEGRVSLDFIHEALPGNPMDAPDTFGEIELADIILISKLTSVLHWNVKKELFRNLHELMKDTAFILLIDSPFWEEDVRNWFSILYVSDEHDIYQSTVVSRRFGYDTCPQSKARIAVLQKKK